MKVVCDSHLKCDNNLCCHKNVHNYSSSCCSTHCFSVKRFVECINIKEIRKLKLEKINLSFE
jgi:hypothetical protein